MTESIQKTLKKLASDRWNENFDPRDKAIKDLINLGVKHEKHAGKIIKYLAEFAENPDRGYHKKLYQEWWDAYELEAQVSDDRVDIDELKEKTLDGITKILESHKTTIIPLSTTALQIKDSGPVAKSIIKIAEKLGKDDLKTKDLSKLHQAVKMIKPHLKPNESNKTLTKALRYAIQGKINQDNTKLAIKQLRAMEGKMK